MFSGRPAGRCPPVSLTLISRDAIFLLRGGITVLKKLSRTEIKDRGHDRPINL